MLNLKLNLYEATTDLFAQLGIPLNSNTALALNAKTILKEHYKDREPYNRITQLYFAGLINDSVFDKSRPDGYSYEDAQEEANNSYEGLMLFALELSKDPTRPNSPTRSEMSELTRTFNRVSQKMPVALLIKCENMFSIALSERFKYKQEWRQGEKVGKVIILRNINSENPHRGHLQILEDLSKHNAKNFSELHEAWLKVLNVDVLNKRFYSELSNWYFWAMDKVKFPDDIEKDAEKRNATNLIRLITRIIFIWFIKEKGLVPEILFDARRIKSILKDFNIDETSHHYYNAIMQNLFFATLNNNQKMDERSFISENNYQGKNLHHNITTLFRYPEMFDISQKEALALFSEIPFLNGGLFDCLDKPDDQNSEKVVRIDGFSTKPKNRAIVPDYLFFGAEREIDLNNIYDTKGKRYKTKGLLYILDSYKFTIAENTPLEEELALDPELLGKVFENLLASYNEETKTTARKQTGSFYTPREIVNYMVDESLKAYLCSNGISADDVEKLFAREDANDTDTGNTNNIYAEDTMIELINKLKILDPACGSGAFPMGVLHRMVEILQKLDPDNKKWRKLQEDRAIEEARDAFKKENQQERDERLKEISDIFENNASDYGRKLFLIENCIFGVDIQPIAVQIAKLRFFISLIIDQKVNREKQNMGIRALPNLETKFVAANTIIELNRPKGSLFDAEIAKKQNEIKDNVHQYFSVTKRDKKMKLQKKEKILYNELGDLFLKNAWKKEVVDKVKSFNRYDQNVKADWFDVELMFGVRDGFDVVIGNPPYGFRTVLTKEDKDYFRKVKKIEFSSGDSAELFVKISFDNLVKMNGFLTFIIPKKSLFGEAWEDTRINYWKKYNLKFILDTGKSFEKVLLEASVFGLKKEITDNNKFVAVSFLADDKIINVGKFIIEKLFAESNTLQIYKAQFPTIIEKINSNKSKEKLIEGKLGLAIGTDFYSDDKTDYKLLKGIDIERYNVRSNRFLKNKENLNWEKAKEFLKPKLLAQRLVAHIENPIPHLKITACYDNEGIIITNTLTSFEIDVKIDEKFWLGYLNSKFVSWYAYNFIYARAIRGMDLYNFYIKQIPLPNITLEQQQPIITRVNQILSAKKKNSAADTKELEKEIDELVYDLYELEEEEIEIIKGGK